MLRFDLERKQAAGLTILDFSTLANSTEIGPESFPVTGLADLPAELRRTVVKILTSPPVNRFLKLTCYSPTPAERIPLTLRQGDKETRGQSQTSSPCLPLSLSPPIP